MLAAICGAVATLVSVVALPGSAAVGLAYGFGPLGFAVLAIGTVAAVLLRTLRRE